MNSSKQDLLVEAKKTGEDYFNAGIDAIAARFGKEVAEANLQACSINALAMALDNHSSTVRRHTDLIDYKLERLVAIFEHLNSKLN